MSDFAGNTLADFLGSVFAGLVLVGFYVLIQWFLAATDVVISYSWSFHGTLDDPTQVWVNLDLRNRSRSKTYYVANIAYMKGGLPVASFDNKSVWGTELRPGTITYLNAAPLSGTKALKDCFSFEVHIRLQNGRQFWLQGSGPGQQKMSKMQRALSGYERRRKPQLYQLSRFVVRKFLRLFDSLSGLRLPFIAQDWRL